MTEATIRLGGMALANGVLVHGPTSWGCAVRLPDGTIRTESGTKPTFAPTLSTPFLRGPVRLAEAFALLPIIRRAVPEARLPFERPKVVGAVIGASVVAGAVRRSSLSPALRETVVAFASMAPALVSLRGGDVTSYHGAEHVSIGTYERGGEPAPKEHERCGSHLIGPLLLSTVVANTRRVEAAGRAFGVQVVASQRSRLSGRRSRCSGG